MKAHNYIEVTCRHAQGNILQVLRNFQSPMPTSGCLQNGEQTRIPKCQVTAFLVDSLICFPSWSLGQSFPRDCRIRTRPLPLNSDGIFPLHFGTHNKKCRTHASCKTVNFHGSSGMITIYWR